MTESSQARRPIVELLSLAAPTIAQMVSYTFMQFIDTWILSRLGEKAATAAANSGMFTFSLISLGMGTLLLVNTLASQSFGRGNFRECGQYLWQGIWLGLTYGAALLLLRGYGQAVFTAFGHAPDLAAMEGTYWRIVMWTAVGQLIAATLGQFMLAIDRPNCVLISAVVGVAANVIAAWTLVLGRLGFASHGIEGAAWAQNIGVCAELVILIGYVLTTPAKFGIWDIAPRWDQLKTLTRVGTPSGLQWFSDVLAWSVFNNGVMALVGTEAMAANTFMFRYMIVSFMPVVGLQSAATALVGRYIGRQQPDVAQRRAHLAFAVSLVYVACCGMVFIFARGPLMRLFTDNPRTIEIGSAYLIFAAIYDQFDAMYIIYTGALRGAGDTLVPVVVMTSLCWTISVGGGYASVLWFKGLGYYGPWIMGVLYGAVVSIYMIRRFLRGKWRDIRLGNQAIAVNA